MTNSHDNPKWKQEWDAKVEKALGMTRNQAKKQLSRDQIIGAFRKLETGSDPHAKKRVDKIQETYDDYTTAPTSVGQEFRDEIDQGIWMSYQIGEFDVPKSRRGKGGVLPRSKKRESFDRYMKSGGEIPKQFADGFITKDPLT